MLRDKGADSIKRLCLSTATYQPRQNKALHPTAYSSVRFGRKLPSLSTLPAAGELVVLLLARGLDTCDTLKNITKELR